MTAPRHEHHSRSRRYATRRHSMVSAMLGALLATLLASMAAAQTAIAGQCPPGYGGVYPHCRPAPPHRYHPTRPVAEKPLASHSGIVLLESKPHSPAVQRRIVDPNKVAPVGGPGPRRSAEDTHGIIFVGGKNAINSQPVPPGHSAGTSAINSQPVPPGRSLHRMPRPQTPIEPGSH